MTDEFWTATDGSRAELLRWADHIEIKQRRLAALKRRLGVPFLHGEQAELTDEILHFRSVADLYEAHQWRRREKK